MKINSFTGVVAIVLITLFPGIAFAQNQSKAKPRKQFFTFYFDISNTMPWHFNNYPLRQLTGTRLVWDWEKGGYHSKDDSIRINDLSFAQKTKGFGLVAYPFGNGNGVRLAVKADYETLPVIKFTIKSPSGTENYLLDHAKAYDMGLGLQVTDRDTGWGIGARSFIFGGAGKIHEPRGDGKRVFAEFGGGVNVGPFGLDLSVKFNWNTLYNPRRHNFMTVPISLRSSISF